MILSYPSDTISTYLYVEDLKAASLLAESQIKKYSLVSFSHKALLPFLCFSSCISFFLALFFPSLLELFLPFFLFSFQDSVFLSFVIFYTLLCSSPCYFSSFLLLFSDVRFSALTIVLHSKYSSFIFKWSSFLFEVLYLIPLSFSSPMPLTTHLKTAKWEIRKIAGWCLL